MNKKILFVSFVLLASIVSSVFTKTAYAFMDTRIGSSYIYTNDGMDVSAPDAYKYGQSISLAGKDGKALKSPIDMFTAQNGRLYVLDSGSGCVLIYDSEFRLLRELKSFKTSDGAVEKLNKPESLFVKAEEDGTIAIYIADTENHRILVADENGNVINIFGKPENLLTLNTDTYLPIRIVVDALGRMSIVARNINMGILQLSEDGMFLGYTGTPKVKVDLFTKFWKSISSREQQSKMAQFVPTEFSNIAIDDKGFIYGTISSLSEEDILKEISSATNGSDITPIKKLNSLGNDILKRQGAFSPLGELSFYDYPSKIIDVAIGPYEIYSLLDGAKGKVFTYDSNGNLLYVFGRNGDTKGEFKRVTAVLYMGYKVLVLDSILCEIVIYELTEYGEKVMNAVESYYNGEYEMSYQYWSEVAKANANFSYAFIGLGKAKYEEGLYTEAMKYFEYAGDRESYSMASEKLRKQMMEKVFPVAFMIILCGSAGLLVFKNGKRFLKYYREA